MDQEFKVTANSFSPEEAMQKEVNEHLFALEKIFFKYDPRPMVLTLIGRHVLENRTQQVIYLFSTLGFDSMVDTLVGALEIAKNKYGQ